MTELEQLQHRDILDGPQPEGTLRSYGGAFLADADGPDCADTRPPTLGEHTQQALESLGFSRAEYDALARAGAFGQATQ